MDEYEIANIADALSSPIRVKIYRILEKEKVMKMSDIYRAVQDLEEVTRPTVFGHVRFMETNGIVETKKIKKKEIQVKLKKRIRIEVEDID